MTQTGWRTVRVFISSTFRDMQAERDHLVKHVFPRLRKLCESRGVTWGEVDLRWGVTDEQAAEGQVLPICLEEINRCRPYFIGILGERYGWVPDEVSPELVEREPWLGEHPDHSVTELEILHGVLNDPEMAKHAFFYFRDPACLNHLADGADRSDYVSEDDRAKDKLESLKERIRRSGFPFWEDYSSPAALGKRVLEDMTAVIDERFPPDEIVDPLDREAMDHEAYAESRERVYIGRQEYFDRLDEHAAANDSRPLVILGESGSGKSALIANWVARYRKEYPDALVFQHYIGGTPYSADWAAMLRRLMGEFKRRFGIDLEIPDNPDELRLAFANWLHMAAERGRVIVVLDALNQLEDRDGAPDLLWLPSVLPENVRLVVSTLAGRALEEIRKRDWPLLVVGPLCDDERRTLIREYLEQYSKSLSASRVECISMAPQSANPLYLRVLLDELRLVRSHEELQERISDYLKAESPYALYGKVIARWEEDYEGDSDLVGDTLSLLWASRRGLSESELLQALGDENGPLPHAKWSPLYLAMSDALVNRNGLLGFAHDFLRTAARDAYVPTEHHQKSVHYRLACYFVKHKPDSERAVDELPWQLMRAEQWKLLKHLLTTPVFLSLFMRVALDNCDNRGPGAGLAAQGRNREFISYWAPMQDHFDIGEEFLSSLSRLRAETADEELFLYCVLASTILMEAGRPEASRAMVEAMHGLRDPWSQRDNDAATGVDMVELLMRARTASDTGDLEEARQTYEQMLSSSLSDAQTDMEMRRVVLNNLAVLQGQIGDRSSAEDRLREQVDAVITQKGEDHGDSQVALTNLANLLCQIGKVEEAESLHRRVLDIRIRQLGRAHFKTLSTLDNLANLLLVKGEDVEAEMHLRAAFDGRRDALGWAHEETAKSAVGLVDALLKLGRNEEALSLCREVARCSKAVYLSGSAEALGSIQRVSSLLSSLGDNQTARSWLSELYEASVERHGVSSLTAQEFLEGLLHIMMNQGDLEAAISMSRAAIANAAQSPATGRVLARMRNNLAMLLHNDSRTEDAEQQLRMAMKELGTDYAGVEELRCTLLYNLGGILTRLGEYDEAIETLTLAVAERKALLGTQHVHTLMSMNLLAEALGRNAQFQEALCTAKELLLYLLSLYPEDHEEVIQCQAHISALELHIAGVTMHDGMPQETLDAILQMQQHAGAPGGMLDGIDDKDPHLLAALLDIVAAGKQPFHQHNDGSSQQGHGDADAEPTEGELVFATSDDVRSMATLLFQHGEYHKAEELLKALLDADCEPAGIHHHLARLCLITDRIAEAREHVAQAWAVRGDKKSYIIARLLWFELALDALTHGDLALHRPHSASVLGRLKTTLQDDGAFMEWTMEPVLEHLKGKMQQTEYWELLSALVDALNGTESLPALDAFAAWRETEPEPLE